MLKIIIKRLIETILALIAIPLMIVFGFASQIAAGSYLKPKFTEVAWAAVSGAALAIVIGLFYLTEKHLWSGNDRAPLRQRRAFKIFGLTAIILAGAGAAGIVVLALIAIGGL